MEFKGDHIEPGQQDKQQAGDMWAVAAPDELAFVWALKDNWQAKVREAIKGFV